MTIKRKIAVVAAAVVLVLCAGILVLLTNLDWIVKNAIERYGSQATGTAVRVRSVSLEPAKGKGTITGLTVANPSGFQAPHILALGSVSIRIEPRSVTTDVVVIDDIRIAAPLVAYEMNENGIANADVLKKNLGAGQGTAPARGEGKGGKDKRLRIRHLVVENARAEVRIAGLDSRTRTVALSRIELKDIGGKNGAPPDAVARQIVSAILSEVTREVGKAGAERLLDKALERALRRR